MLRLLFQILLSNKILPDEVTLHPGSFAFSVVLFNIQTSNGVSLLLDKGRTKPTLSLFMDNRLAKIRPLTTNAEHNI